MLDGSYMFQQVSLCIHEKTVLFNVMKPTIQIVSMYLDIFKVAYMQKVIKALFHLT